ncbi:MAG: DsrE family protein [Candidatus Thorarchaeota archaeon]|jgi:sulfur relay (sulfurtransferase) DsrF/TusC family protein
MMEFTERPVLILVESRPFGMIMAAEGWRAAVGMFGMDHEPQLLFLGDGVYGLIKDQDIKHIRMFKSTFESFDGRICVSKASLKERNISPEEIFENVEILDEEGVAKAFVENDLVLTF